MFEFPINRRARASAEVEIELTRLVRAKGISMQVVMAPLSRKT